MLFNNQKLNCHPHPSPLYHLKNQKYSSVGKGNYKQACWPKFNPKIQCKGGRKKTNTTKSHLTSSGAVKPLLHACTHMCTHTHTHRCSKHTTARAHSQHLAGWGKRTLMKTCATQEDLSQNKTANKQTRGWQCSLNGSQEPHKIWCGATYHSTWEDRMVRCLCLFFTR